MPKSLRLIEQMESRMFRSKNGIQSNTKRWQSSSLFVNTHTHTQGMNATELNFPLSLTH